MSSFRFGQAEIASKDFHKDRQVTDQPVITTRIYVLHKITIALKFISYINSDLPIPAKKLQTPG